MVTIKDTIDRLDAGIGDHVGDQRMPEGIDELLRLKNKRTDCYQGNNEATQAWLTAVIRKWPHGGIRCI